MIYSEPYRLFFPMGVFYLFVGALLWLPQIWTADHYPILLHRYLVLNGFVASFIGGFLMTAVPKFSKTFEARQWEVISFLIIGILGIYPAMTEQESYLLVFSALQGIILLGFIFQRIFKRKENPPYSFVFIFVGLFLWVFSSLAGVFGDYELFKEIHYEGAVASIILGVGSRLIPGILGHVEIVKEQRKVYETPGPVLGTVPWYFFLFIFFFVLSYFFSFGAVIRAIIVSIIGLQYWQLHKRPVLRTALTWSIWTAGWLIVLSFILRAVWQEGMIHGSHAFFLNGIVLLSLLVATRVIQSHGPKLKELENWKGLYLVTFLVFFTSLTRVLAYVMPATYLTHLGYSSFVLLAALIIWSYKYLPFVKRI